MRKIDLAYTAGIVDGEGCIGLYLSSNKSFRVHVTVTNTNEWLIQWLKFAYGGNVCSAPVPVNCKLAWRWNIVSNQATNFLETIMPFLKLKRQQAELAIEFQNRRRGHRMSPKERVLAEADKILMSQMNKHGDRRLV